MSKDRRQLAAGVHGEAEAGIGSVGRAALIWSLRRSQGRVTVPDGEGGFRVKLLPRATDEELDADLDIHDQNVRGALDARRRAKKRNNLLQPVMREHKFNTAGEAMKWLRNQ